MLRNGLRAAGGVSKVKGLGFKGRWASLGLRGKGHTPIFENRMDKIM